MKYSGAISLADQFVYFLLSLPAGIPYPQGLGVLAFYLNEKESHVMFNESARNRRLLIVIAEENPNAFLSAFYKSLSSMTEDDCKELKYLVNTARSSLGYDQEQDKLMLDNII